jgi:hypothetical protein
MPFTFTRDKYFQGIRDAVLISDRNTGPINLAEAMKFIESEDVRAKVKLTTGEMMNFLPTKDFYLNVDKAKVLASGTVKPKDAGLIADKVEFSINKSYILKNEWAILNLIAANNWERPIYFDHSLIFTNNIFVTDWLQFEGLAYRFVPIKSNKQNVFSGRIDSDILYNNVMNKFTWGNINSPDIYLDDYNQKSVKIIQARYMFARLAEQLNLEGKKDSAVVVLDKMFEIFPNERMPLSYDSYPAVEQYYASGAIQKANVIVRVMANNCFNDLDYYLSLPNNMAGVVSEEQNRLITFLRNLTVITKQYNQDDLNKEIDGRVQNLMGSLRRK